MAFSRDSIANFEFEGLARIANYGMSRDSIANFEFQGLARITNYGFEHAFHSEFCILRLGAHSEVWLLARILPHSYSRAVRAQK